MNIERNALRFVLYLLTFAAGAITVVTMGSAPPSAALPSSFYASAICTLIGVAGLAISARRG